MRFLQDLALQGQHWQGESEWPPSQLVFGELGPSWGPSKWCTASPAPPHTTGLSQQEHDRSHY